MSRHDLIERMVDYFHAGGGLMVPLMALSLIMWTLAIVKGIRFLRERRREIAPERCVDLFRGGRAVRQAQGADWQWDILSRYMEERSGDPELNREMLGAIRGRQESRTMRHIGTILILAAVAPLLGLLGTVTGMITTFDVISEFGTGNARALASGISEALVTTQSGLVVAVPGLLLGVLLYRQAERLKHRMELFCIGLQEKTDMAPSEGERA
jgi:biopolymer transport protein ExbB